MSLHYLGKHEPRKSSFQLYCIYRVENNGALTWYIFNIDQPVFTARRYAKRGICRRRVSVCLCVCLFVCVCLSHSGIVSKRLNVGSRKQRRTIAP